MILTIDVGNSNSVLVLYDLDYKIYYSHREDTVKDSMPEIIDHWIDSLIDPILTQFKIDDFALSCVVPSITHVLIHSLQNKLKQPGFVLSMNEVENFVVHLDHAQELGADLIATSFGAMRKYQMPCIIADLGSATKITVVNEKSEFASGLILPGLKVAQLAMNAFIPHLPEIPLTFPKQLLGRDTIACMQAGLMYSNVDAILGISQRIEKELNQKCTKILTGGLSIVIKDALDEFNYEPNLLNEGLLYLYLKKHV
jgi:type III pantothenate kinase